MREKHVKSYPAQLFDYLSFVFHFIAPSAECATKFYFLQTGFRKTVMVPLRVCAAELVDERSGPTVISVRDGPVRFTATYCSRDLRMVKEMYTAV